MNTGVKSPVNRIGGKFFLTSWLVQFIPGHVIYTEPFFGAGHLLFTKLPSQVEIISDVDGYLISFFRTIQHPETRQMLIDRLDHMLYSRSLWNELRMQWKQGNIPGGAVEASAQWFYLNRTCFSGDQERGGFAMPSITGRNPVQSFRNVIDNLDTVAERLRNVCIENLDYRDCILRYDSEDTLFYADPPYLNAEGYYGKDSFTRDDHYKLSELLHNVKGKCMVSHYTNEVYDRLYQGWNRYEYQSFKGSHKAEKNGEKPKTTEVLYCNFKPEGKTKSLFHGHTF